MRAQAANAEHAESMVLGTQRHTAQRAILKPQFFQRFPSPLKPIITFPVRNAQRLLLLVNPPIRGFFHGHIWRRELARSGGMPKHLARAFFEHDKFQEIKIQQWTKKRSEMAREILRR